MTPDSVEVNVVVDHGHLESIDEVAEALADAGLQVHQTLELAGVISGAIKDADLLERLSLVDGVASVERVRTIQLPPPDGTVQ